MRCDNIHFVRPISAPHHALITRDEVTKLPFSTYCGREGEGGGRITRIFLEGNACLRSQNCFRDTIHLRVSACIPRRFRGSTFNRIDRNVQMTMGEGEAETTMSSFEFTGALNWIFSFSSKFHSPRNRITYLRSIRIPFLKFNTRSE